MQYEKLKDTDFGDKISILKTIRINICINSFGIRQLINADNNLVC